MNEVIRCKDGFEVDATLRPAGVTLLERKHGTRLSEIVAQWSRQGAIGIEGGRAVLTALCLQRHPEMTWDQARQAVLDHEMEMAFVLGRLGNIGYESADNGSLAPGVVGPVPINVEGTNVTAGADGKWHVTDNETTISEKAEDGK